MQSKTWVAAVIMLIVAGVHLIPGITIDDSALMDWITTGIEILGPIFIVLRGWAMGRHTLAGRTLPGRTL